jgi:hypothetical protein
VARGPLLLTPQRATRVRRNLNTDTPLPPEEPAGENPPDGAVLDLWLPAGTKGVVTLEVFDAAGALVRRFASDDELLPPDLGQPVAPYWMEAPRALPAAPGLHRFVWDLRHPMPRALEREYPISAIPGRTPLEPQGPYVLPGAYRVRLTANGQTSERTLEVRMDPRVAASGEDLEKQHALSLRVCEAMARDAAALGRVRGLRAALAKGDPKKGAARDAELAALEGAGGRRRGGAPAPASDLARLNGQLVSLLGVLQGADVAPTAATEAAVTALTKDLDDLLTRLDALEKGVGRK